MHPPTWRIGAACFDEAALTLTVGGAAMELERRPLELLSLLLAHAGEVVTKAEILDRIWPDREVSEASLTKCVARLRAALGDGEHSMIKTVHGFGYRLAAPVIRQEGTGPRSTQGAALLALEAGQAVPGRGNFTLVRRLGAGGFGDAWLAEQPKSRDQRVFKFAANADGLAALRREITLGRLLREGLGPRADLVRILDWRLDEMPAFVEIAFYELGSLADWAAAQGGLASVPLALRLGLVAQIADALAAIHGMAVLHKDLKPANVLMRLEDGAPAIALADFGSGRALDAARLDALGITRMDAELTGQDSTAGTQMYRAPELLGGGAATVLADIYALGVLLFQMTAGDLKRPLAQGWEAAVADPLLREDIAWAAAGDPARRLADAAGLARRLRGLPDRHAARAREAAAAAAMQRAQASLARARARRGPLIGLFAVLTVALLASTGLYLRAERAGARARTVTGFLTDDVFSAANPLLTANPNASIKSVLGAASADLDRRFSKGDLDRAAIEQAIGGAYAGLTDPVHAQPLLRDALAVFSARLGDDDRQTQSVRLALGALGERMQDNAAAKAAGLAVLSHQPRDADIELGGRFLVIWADCNTEGNNQACVARLRPFLEEAGRRIGATDRMTLQVQSDLAYELGQMQDFAAAIPMARATVALTKQAYGPDHLLVQEQQFHLAEVLNEAGQVDEAAVLLSDVRRRQLAASGGETDLSARAAVVLGAIYLTKKRFADALAIEQIALGTMRVLHGELHPTVRNTLNDIAFIDAAMGQMPDAIANERQALELQRRASGMDQADTIWFENNLANFQHTAGDLAGAEATYRDVVARARRTFSHGEWDLGHFEFHLGEVLAEEGRPAEARPLLIDAVALLQARLGPDSPRTIKARKTLARLDGR